MTKYLNIINKAESIIFQFILKPRLFSIIYNVMNVYVFSNLVWNQHVDMHTHNISHNLIDLLHYFQYIPISN